MYLIETGHQVPVLTVDPSSTPRTGGSITRQDPDGQAGHPPGRVHPAVAHLGHPRRGSRRPSGRRSSLLARPPAMTSILVETVEVGQSESRRCRDGGHLRVPDPRAPATSSGHQEGRPSSSPIVVVNKADGAHAVEAKSGARAGQRPGSSIRLDALWRAAGVDDERASRATGVAELWDAVLRHRQCSPTPVSSEARRRARQVEWTWAMVRDAVLDQCSTRRLPCGPSESDVRTPGARWRTHSGAGARRSCGQQMSPRSITCRKSAHGTGVDSGV